MHPRRYVFDRLQTSTNLADWVPLVTLACHNLPMSMSDPAAANSKHRFYRVKVGP